jgi:uncharacterized protein YbjT (DUF2867 family)
MEKRILILGATGRTGQLAVNDALKKGFAVTALVRNPDKLTISSDKLTVVKGSPTNINDVRIAMQGCHYVISLLSALSEKESFSFKKIVPPHTLKRTIQNVIAVMKENNIRRVMTLSSIGAGDSYLYAPWFMKLMIKITNFKVVFADHNAQEQLLMQSGLDWTIARPVGLNNEVAKANLVVSYDKTPKPFKMSRMQLAQFFINQIDKVDYMHKAPILSEKP